MSDEKPLKPEEMKNHDPAEDGHRMMEQTVAGLGIPKGTSMVNWPKKPLSKPTGKAGHAAPHALERTRAPRSTHRKSSRSSKRNYRSEMGLTWGFD